MAVISFSRRLRELAEAQPDRPAITCGDDTVTRAELVQRGNRKEDREQGPVTITRYVCDRCGTAWEYENDKDNQKAGWSVVGR